MVDEGLPTRSLSISESIDLTDRFDQAANEYLTISQTRLVAISGGAIYLVDIEEGVLTEAHELTIRLWEPSQTDDEIPPDEERMTFTERLVNSE